jgi:hypothetical protein
MNCSTTSLSAGVNLACSSGRRHAGLRLDLLHHVEQHLGGAQIGLGRFVDHLGDDRLVFRDFALLLDLDGIPAIAGCDLNTLAGLPASSGCQWKPSAMTC